MQDMFPMMKKSEVRIFKRALLSRASKHINILEWGSGGSTIYFTDFLDQKGISYTWTSIEYNKQWFEKVKNALQQKPQTNLILCDVQNNRLRQRTTDMEEYITYPASLGTSFDVIFVDGRKRRRCLLEAKHLIKNDGIVFLHDAQRHYYHCALKEYPTSRFATPFFWYGTLHAPPRIEKVLHQCQNVFLRSTYSVFIAPYYIIKRTVRALVYRRIQL